MPTTKSLIIEPALAYIYETTDGVESYQEGVNRTDFATQYPACPLTGVQQVSYEPSNGIYHINRTDGTLDVYQAASDDVTLQWCETNYDTVKTWITAQVAAQDSD